VNAAAWFACGILAGTAVGVSAIGIAEMERDPVLQSPNYYTVRLDNDQLRVLEYRLAPGQKEPMHSHPPGFVYVLAPAKVRVTSLDGTASIGESTPGEVVWRNAVTHAAENVGNTEAHVLAVELKPCKPKN
jgi:beta-alanine degradation protein BauB